MRATVPLEFINKTQLRRFILVYWSNWPHRDTRGYSTAKRWRICRTALLFWYGNYPAVHFPGWLLDCCLADSVRGLPVNSVSRFMVVAKLAARRIRRGGSCHKTSLRTILTFSAGNPLTIIFAANAILSRCIPLFADWNAICAIWKCNCRSRGLSTCTRGAEFPRRCCFSVLALPELVVFRVLRSPG